MSFQFANDAAAFIATSRSILRDHGLEVRIGSDFQEYKEIIAEHRPMQVLGYPFDPAHQTLSEDKAFWLTGWNSDGQLIHTQAAKAVDLHGRPLSGFLLKNFRMFPPPFKDIDLKRSRFRATPGSHLIDGHVVYHGEVWMAPEQGTYRGSGLSTVLARTGLLEVIRRWDPDWVYGFMLRAVAFKGFAERMGYMHNEPGALLWYREGNDDPAEAFLTYLSRADAAYMLDMPVADLVRQTVPA
ncbi:MAG: hypothetical protein ABJJ69_20075 [Paracoccaceae bacterium]